MNIQKLICLLLLITLITAAGCVPGDGNHTADEPAGFFWGIWHGWIAPISLIWGLLFNPEIRIYEPSNSGWAYDFGFYIAVISGFGGISFSRSAGKRKREKAEEQKHSGPDNTSKDDIEFEREEGSSENNVVPIKPEDDSEDELPGKRDDMSPNYRVKRTSSENLLVKLEDTGTRLGEHWNIHEGISTGCDTAFLINELKRQQLIDENVQSDMLIKSQLRPSQKWEGTSTPLICIPSSEDIPWNWSARESGSEAEGVFADNYPAIRKHLKGYSNLLDKPKFKGKFYWEWPSSKLYTYLERPKIVCPYTGNSMRACYDQSGAVVLKPAFFIPTESLSLLAILNSKLFDWHTKARYQEKSKGPIEFKQSNMASFPVAAETIEHKANLSDLVQQILDDPDNLEIFDIEWEIDALVYDLYELTTAEIALIEKGNNP